MRRRLSLAGLIAIFVLALWPHGSAPAVGALRDSGKTVANQVDHSMPAYTVGELRRDTGERVSAASVGSTGGATLSVTSPVVDAGQLFERVGVHYRAAWGTEDSLILEVRTSADAKTWGEWTIFHPEEDLADTATNTWYVAPQVAPQDSRYAQYRVWLTGGDPAALQHVALTFIDVNDLNAGPLARLGHDVGGALADIANAYFGESRGSALAAPTGASSIYTRQDWGADESLFRWDPSYVPFQKAVIHHTVTSDGGNDVADELRSIYYFHAVTRGWGDIGYHYLVDKYGNIFQGRGGGDDVIGGHAFGWNDGTFAVSAIGDYSIQTPTPAMQGAIANIIALKLKQYGIAPFGSGPYTHKEQRNDGSWIPVTTSVPNVLGHRDCTFQEGIAGAQTACPGGRIYSLMDRIRGLAQNAWDQGYTYLSKIEPQLVPVGFPGQTIQVPVTVHNRGTSVIPAGTSVGYRLLKGGAPVQTGPGTELPTAIAPGASTTVNASFIAPAKGEYIVRWGLQTGSAWWSQIYNDPFRDQWFESRDWSADWRGTSVPTSWTAGQTRVLTVTVRNNGGRVWNAAAPNPVKLGYYWLSTAFGNRFDGAEKISLPGDVQPGQTVRLMVPVTAPQYPTNYSLVLDLHKENEFWFQDKGLRPDDTEVTVAMDWKAQYTLATQPKFEAGKTLRVPITITNTGLGTFPVTNAFPVALGYHWYDAAGQTVVWDGLRTKLPADLLSGKSVTVEAEVRAPDQGGSFTLRFDLVQEGVGWFSGQGVPMVNTLVAVAGPVVPVYAVAYEPGVTTLARSGSLTAVPFTIRNTSNFTWQAAGDTPVRLSYHWSDAQGRTVVWEGLRTLLPRDVAPGEAVSVNAQVAIPTAQGTYTLRWDLVHEGVTWFSAKGARPLDQTVVVGPPPFYGGSFDVSTVPASAPAGGTFSAPLRVQNLSNFAWDPLVNLSYHWYDASGKAVVWEGARTPLTGIVPNEVRGVAASVVAPSLPGTYTLRFDLVHEGVTWFSFHGMQTPSVTVRVEQPAAGARYYTVGEATGAVGATITVPVLLENAGQLPLAAGRVNLAYHLYAESGAVYVWDGARTALPADLAPGARVLLNATVRMPERAGPFTLHFDLVEEGVAWFSTRGVPTVPITLTVQ